jgi:SAM-dependent methyltransferase
MGISEDLAQVKQSLGNGAGYMDARPKLREFLEALQKNTVVHNEDLWAGQINDNWEHIVSRGSFSHLQGCGQDKTCIIVGASPALKKNVQCLKDIEGQYRDKFLLISVNSAAQFLLENGVIPDIVISVDCDEEVWTRDLSKINREDITLLCSPFVWPEVPRNWKGKLYFIPMGCKDEETQSRIVKQLGVHQPVPGCGNAFNEAVFIGWNIFNCRNYVFVGSELSWPIDGKYYVDEKHSNDEEDAGIGKFHAMDIYGNPVLTTAGHWVFKTWLEDLASRSPGVFINATEAGILGMSPEDGRLPWIKQFFLGAAIAYIKQIYSDCADWHFLESMKWTFAYSKGYDCKGIPNETMIKSLKPKTILDVGCGSGSSVQELVEKGFDAYGIDFAVGAMGKWNGVSDRCMLAYADDIPAEDEQFDLAISDILEHVPVEHVDSVIKEVARVSKRQMFNVEFGPAQYLIDGRIEPHMTQRPPQWWRKEFQRCGLNVIGTSGTKTFVTEKKRRIIYGTSRL